MKADASSKSAGYRTDRLDRLGRVRWIASATVELAPEITGVMPTVRPRPPRYWDPVVTWYQTQRTRNGVFVVLGGERTPYAKHDAATLPRWQRPPMPEAPVYGWRGRLIAEWIITWRDRRPRSRYFRKWTWAALHAIAKGQRPFSLRVWKDVVEQVAWTQAASAAAEARAQPVERRVTPEGPPLGGAASDARLPC